MSHHFSADLQRLRYWQGQQLKSKDLRDQMSYNALLQAWHDRALHNAYGVRTGLQVLLENAEVVVKPGIAYDIHGRGLVLAEDHRLGLPTQIPPSGFYLVVQRKSSGGADNGASLLQFRWLDSHRFNPHDGVALARLLPGPGLDRYFNLPVARPQTEPLRFYSASLAPKTPWEHWELDADQNLEGGNPILGLKVDVDTSAAGFTKTPCYFVWLSGELWSPDLPVKYVKRLQTEGEETEGEATEAEIPLAMRLHLGWSFIQILVMRFGHIAAPTPTGFTYYLWMPHALMPSSAWEVVIEDLFALALQNRFTLNWLGIQMDQEKEENYGITGQNSHD
jgi:hypothetical protein